MTDTTAPQLKSLGLPTVIDVGGGTKNVTVTARAEDEAGGSGVDSMTVFFDKNVAFSYGTGNYFEIGGLFGNGEDTFRDGTPTVASTDFTLTNNTEPGTYHVSRVWVRDAAGNQATYTTEQLEALGINTSISVVATLASTPASRASVAGSFSHDANVLTLGSSDWSATGSNAFTLSVHYDATQAHFGGASFAAASSSALSTSVSEVGGIGTVTVTGSVVPLLQSQAALQLTMIPATTSGSFSYSVDTFTVNGRAQAFTQGAAGSIYHGSSNGEQLVKHAGSEFIDGGAGVDTVAFAATKASYTVQHSDTGFTVKDGNGDVSTLVNVERLAFTDKSLALDVDGVGGQVYRLYQAAFDRQPDDAGVGYWMSQMDHGASLHDTAAFFISSKEFGDTYGAGVDTAAFVNALYDNVLHRAPDQAGFDFWVSSLNTIDRATALVQFSESQENVAQVVGSIQDGFAYTPWA
jgi:hypothetical protein